MRAFVKEVLPLAEAVASLKSKIVKGRAPNSGSAKPANSNKTVRTCPVCFRAIAVVSGHMAHHGYERPGDGFQTASCPGTRFAPLEVSSAGLEWLIGALRKNLAADENLLVKQATEPRTLLARRERKGPLEAIPREDPLWPQLFKRYLAGVQVRINANRESIPPLEKRLAEWQPAAQS